jgi:hypothetical protein
LGTPQSVHDDTALVSDGFRFGATLSSIVKQHPGHFLGWQRARVMGLTQGYFGLHKLFEVSAKLRD